MKGVKIRRGRERGKKGKKNVERKIRRKKRSTEKQSITPNSPYKKVLIKLTHIHACLCTYVWMSFGCRHRC